MPWVVGIDEAGYGPNLGPLVQAAVALKLPASDPAGWDTLKGAVRRAHEKPDGRLLIDDSKKVYTKGGFEALEAVAYALFGVVPSPIESFLTQAVQTSADDLKQEAWFDGSEQLPIAVSPDALSDSLGQWLSAYKAGIYGMHFNVVPAPRFNQIVDSSGSKATALSTGLTALLQAMSGVGHVTVADSLHWPIAFLCDKQGGRNFYAGILQDAFPDGWVIAERESAEESRYRIELLPRDVTVTFRPRADGDSVAVALASMVCKYLRELCMRQFNRFWATHVPGVEPTAGYPVDAKRFYAEIQPAMAKLGLTADQVWRKR